MFVHGMVKVCAVKMVKIKGCWDDTGIDSSWVVLPDLQTISLGV